MKIFRSDEEIISEAVKIYFDYNCTVTEAVERAKEIYSIVKGGGL